MQKTSQAAVEHAATGFWVFSMSQTLQNPSRRSMWAACCRERIAREMLVACESICREAGFRELMLHARVADDAALALYSSCGYEEVARDSMMVSLQRIRPRALMRKRL